MNVTDNLINKHESHALSKITGKTTISHRNRIKLGITCMQYCILELIEKSVARHESLTEQFFYQKIGIQKEELYKELHKLATLEFITKNTDGSPKVTQKWLSAFDIPMEEFEEFWNRNERCAWPGSSKKETLKKYKEVREFYSAAYLLRKRNEYLEFLVRKENDFRQIMGCSVFLNLDKERFNIDWKNASKETLQEPIPVNKSVVAINHKELFSK